jgi:catechol 2,3-dioxygenase-like lactoylglutathione lyase family enzyme
MTRDMLKKIDHINIVVKDLYAAKKFFLDLGFKIIHEGTLTGSWIDTITNLKNVKAEYCALGLKNGQTNLELITYSSPESKTSRKAQLPNQHGIRHLAFEVANIEAIGAQLKKAGVTFFSEIQHYEPTKKKLCYLYGPEGIILELAEYKK